MADFNEAFAALDRLYSRAMRPAGAQRIAFVPWKSGNAGEIPNQLTRTFSAPRFTQLYFSEEEYPAIKSLTDVDELYVIGHCKHKPFTSAYIFPQRNIQVLEDFKTQNGLRFDEVARRLIASGLQKAWRGDLKFYNCSSAGEWTYSDPLLGSDEDSEPFGSRCARELSQYACQKWGYEEDLAVDRDAEGHKTTIQSKVRAQLKRIPLPMEARFKPF
ncbi:MAG TPA: hypothetical protein VH601_07920 [Bryobacteraceae bacterium]|jgi:hypothetical protein